MIGLHLYGKDGERLCIRPTVAGGNVKVTAADNVVLSPMSLRDLRIWCECMELELVEKGLLPTEPTPSTPDDTPREEKGSEGQPSPPPP